MFEDKDIMKGFLPQITETKMDDGLRWQMDNS
jgi:hypothetical protein